MKETIFFNLDNLNKSVKHTRSESINEYPQLATSQTNQSKDTVSPDNLNHKPSKGKYTKNEVGNIISSIVQHIIDLTIEISSEREKGYNKPNNIDEYIIKNNSKNDVAIDASKEKIQPIIKIAENSTKKEEENYNKNIDESSPINVLRNKGSLEEDKGKDSYTSPRFCINGQKVEIIDSLDNFDISECPPQPSHESGLVKEFSNVRKDENLSMKSETPEIKLPVSNSLRDRQKMFERSSTIVENSNKKLDTIMTLNRGNSSIQSKYEPKNNSLSGTFENKYKTLNIPDKKENSNNIFNRGSTFSDRLKFLEKGGDKGTAVKENRHVKKLSEVNNNFSEQEENFLKNAMKSLRSSENNEALKDINTEKENPLRKSIKIAQLSEKLEEKLNRPISKEIFMENEPCDDYQNMISDKALIKNVKRKKGKKAF